MNRRTLCATLPLLLLPSAASGHSFKHGTIAIGHAWALPVQHGDGQLFFPLLNKGSEADALVAARSAICSHIELRQNNRYDDPPLQSIVLEPRRPVPMRPTALHLRLVGMRAPLVLDDRFPLILDFLKSGETLIEVMVEEKPGT